MHQCVMATAKRPPYLPLDKLDNTACILNGVTSPENVGNIIRSLCAFNIKSLIIDAKTVTPYIRRAIRVSMGNIFEMKIHYTADLTETIKTMQLDKYQIIGTANQKGAENISNFSFKEKNAFIIGSEGHGIEDTIKKECDNIVYIPINDHVLHLNANNAATIFAYECSKQLKLV
jgi:tRNA G18 (ribose-2'-O)-methylase SpoU